MTRRRKILATLLLAASVGGVAGPATYSAFSSTTTNSANLFSNAKPGDSDTGCINVSYDGTLDSTVRLYANVTGALPQYLTLTVTRGTDPSPSFDSCAGFTPDGTNYIGAGNGVVYSGTLAAFPASYASGLVDPIPASPETWSNPESHSYRFTITLQNDDAAQGLNGSADFTWEARNQ
jgi:hypothetical protein